MKLLNKQTITDYAASHADAKQRLLALTAELEDGKWQTPHELKRQYPSTDFPGNGQVILNIKGNQYRVLLKVDYEYQIIIVKKAGKHSEYDKWRIK